MANSTKSAGPILIAEADNDTRSLYSYAFATFARPVLEARDGREALTLALGCEPAVIVMELALAYIDGLALCEILRLDRATRNVPIVVATSLSAPQTLADPRLAGIAVFVKPIAIEDVCNQVRMLLAPAAASNHPDNRARRVPPPVRCPECDRPLVHSSSHVGGIRGDEQWDYFRCWSCSRTFQYRHRTRTLRAAG